MWRLRSEDIEWRWVDDEAVAIDLRDGLYLTLNSSGASLFARLAEGATEADLVAFLTETYDTTEEQATADVSAFLAALQERELLKGPDTE